MAVLIIEFALYKTIEIKPTDINDVDFTPHLRLTEKDLQNFRPSWAAISENGDGMFNDQIFFGDDHAES